MGRLAILFDDVAQQALYSGGAWTLPLTNMTDADIQNVARSGGAAPASTKFKVDLGVPREISGFAFGPTNLSPGSQWLATAYSDSSYVTATYTTGLQTVAGEVIDWTTSAAWLEWENPGFWIGISDYLALSELPQYCYHLVPTASLGLAAQQWWQFEFFDAGNPDGFVQQGELLMGSVFRPSNNYLENNFQIIPLTDVEESHGGKRVYDERGLRRAFRCTVEHLSNDELFNAVLRMALRSSISRHVFFIPDDTETTYANRRSFLATFKSPPPITQALANRGSTIFDVEEVL